MGGHGRAVLVVGASRGIGAAIAEAFVNAGERVVATHRGGGVPVDGAHAVTCEVTDPGSVAAAVSEATALVGVPEVVVYNAGITRDALVVRMDDQAYEQVVDTNMTGAFRVVKAVLRPMLRARVGSIVLVSSVSARAGVSGQANYTAAKAGLEGFARTVAREYASKGIRCNVVAPGPTDTAMVAAMPDKAREAMIADVPLGRLGRPEEIADAVRWISEATFVTGVTLPVAGGAALGL